MESTTFRSHSLTPEGLKQDAAAFVEQLALKISCEIPDSTWLEIGKTRAVCVYKGYHSSCNVHNYELLADVELLPIPKSRAFGSENYPKRLRYIFLGDNGKLYRHDRSPFKFYEVKLTDRHSAESILRLAPKLNVMRRKFS